MITNIKIELTDEQRADLQEQITGKRKLITRAELHCFVSGCIMGALSSEEVHMDKPCFEQMKGTTTMPQVYADRYADKSDAWKAGWLRGWNTVGNAMSK